MGLTLAALVGWLWRVIWLLRRMQKLEEQEEAASSKDPEKNRHEEHSYHSSFDNCYGWASSGFFAAPQHGLSFAVGSLIILTSAGLFGMGFGLIFQKNWLLLLS